MLQGRELAGAQNQIKALESLLLEQMTNTNQHTDTKGPKASAKQQQKSDAMFDQMRQTAEKHAIEGAGTAEEYAELADQSKLRGRNRRYSVSMQKADAMFVQMRQTAEKHAIEGAGTAEEYAELADQSKLQTVAQDQLTVWLGEEQSIIQDAQRRKQPVSAETDRTFNLLRPMQLFASISDHALRGLATVRGCFSLGQ